ncbi:MAG: aminodeoxychorismate/anthranilate synthase component II [Myxococcales bacterium]|nr:aminodeoxychorismate/anthranilate synthase component II [Myxococcales bacterium]MCB9522183.1 aminodeoxychorismate/anthranilate synthase component II [Myxococcales bacterium]
MTSPARVLLVDNYDSFTHNLYQALAVLGAQVEVHRNDALDLAAVAALAPTHIVLSPGPGHPENARDFGICGPIVDTLKGRLPILGVCLGHQGIAHRLGAAVVRAPSIWHGKVDRVHHDGRGIFAGLPQPMEAMRYHSLVVDPATLPPELEITARNGEGLIMAYRHRTLPLVGVQFHPESIGTPEGPALLANFLDMTAPEAP